MLAERTAVPSFVITLMRELSCAFVRDLAARAEPRIVASRSDDAGASFLSRHERD